MQSRNKREGKYSDYVSKIHAREYNEFLKGCGWDGLKPGFKRGLKSHDREEAHKCKSVGIRLLIEML